MDIKEFKGLKKAYMLTKIENNRKIDEVSIKSIGRKYVTLDDYQETQFETCNQKECLKEKIQCGWSKLLFPSKEQADNYIEKEELIRWILSMTYVQAEQFSLEDLRKVKGILEKKKEF